MHQYRIIKESKYNNIRIHCARDIYKLHVADKINIDRLYERKIVIRY